MKVWLDNYFGFTKREYNGLLVLITLLLILSVLPYGFELYYNSNKSISASEQASLNELVIVNQEQKNNYTKIRTQIEDNEASISISLFKFDPNLINQEQWQKLGLSAKQAQSILNYRNKGGQFYKPEDLQKMYTISPKKYQQLAPFIAIETNTSTYKKPVYTNKSTFAKKELIVVEVNSADTILLTDIKGIGPAFAKRIAKYREKLGGFYAKEQLMEVYGLDSLKYNEIKTQIRVNIANITQININTAEFDDMKNHPYLKFKQINAILQYRKQHGKFNSIEDLKKVLLLTPQIIQNITPYLSF